MAINIEDYIKVIKEINTSYNNKITEYPVENGSKISDHITNEQPKIELKICAGSLYSQHFSSPFTAKQLKDMIERWSNEKTELNYRQHKNCYIESFVIMESKDNLDGFEGTITLKKIKITQVVTGMYDLGKNVLVTDANGNPTLVSNQQPDKYKLVEPINDISNSIWKGLSESSAIGDKILGYRRSHLLEYAENV